MTEMSPKQSETRSAAVAVHGEVSNCGHWNMVETTAETTEP